MTILHVFPYSFKISGGHSNAILAFMQAQSMGGMNVVGISPPFDGDKQADRSQYESLDIREVLVSKYDAALADFLSSKNGTLVVFYEVSKMTKQLAKKIRATGNRYMLSSEGILHYRGAIHYFKKLIYLNLMSLRFIRNASAFHFITRREMKRAIWLLPLKKAPFLMVPNVVDRDVAAISFNNKKYQQDPFTFIYLGRIDPWHKGLDIAIEAFSKVASKWNCRLRIAGPDWQGGASKLRELSIKLECSDQIEILEPQYGEQKWRFLESGNLFLALSRWEAFGIAIVEAMAAGTPVLASKQLNLADDMRVADVAIISKLSVNNLEKEMARAMEHPDTLQTIGEKARDWSTRQFCSAAVGERFRKELLKID